VKSLRRGDQGDDVRILQRALEELLFNVGAIDGDFGAKTENAVREFQFAANLVVDGVVGPLTWASIITRTTETAAEPATLPPSRVERAGSLLLPSERCWPLRALADGRKPEITSRHKIHNPERKNHNGCDFFFRFDPRRDLPMYVGDGGRTSRWHIPPGTLAIAQADGEIELASSSRTGFRVWVRHAGGLATGAFHLTGILPGIAPGSFVRMGDPLGPVGDNPIDIDAIHLHGELYKGPLRGYPEGTLDPEIFLAGARVLPAVPRTS
jgi:murein DD-endopeptidase MepM/ murein hydrolase activator NlpD